MMTDNFDNIGSNIVDINKADTDSDLSAPKWADFPKLKTFDALEKYFDNRAYNHTGFFHYTRLPIANSVVGNKKFWLSNVRGFNDIKDREQFGDSGEITFSMCFSTGVHENLPLWYMYSGLNGKGARFDFTSAQVKSLVENGKYTLCQKKTDGSEWKTDLDVGMVLTEDDFETEFRDVLYSDTDRPGNAELKYSTLVDYNMPRAELQKYIDKHPGFLKKLIWSYERETRLIVRLKGDAVDFMRRNYKKVNLATDDCQFVVTLDFNDLSKVDKGMKITFGPDTKNLDEVIGNPDYAAIRDFCLSTSNIFESEHAGEFAFDFCRGCTKK